MVQDEGIEVVVDLRGEATGCAAPEAKVEWIQIPLSDNSSQPQEEGFQKAIEAVIGAYHQK
jgi:hypothetical protein